MGRLTLRLAVEVIRNNMAVRQQNDLRLYLDVISDPAHVSSKYCNVFAAAHEGFSPLQPEMPAGCIMIFLKHFDATRQTLYGIGKVYVLRTAKVGDLNQYINEDWPVSDLLDMQAIDNDQVN